MPITVKLSWADGTQKKQSFPDTSKIQDLIQTARDSHSNTPNPEFHIGFPPKKLPYICDDELLSTHVKTGTVILVREKELEPFGIRRVINADNSCLFNAILYLRLGTRDISPTELRRTVADAITSDASKYSDSFLGKSRAEYVHWIMLDTSWGGEIECENFHPPFFSQVSFCQ
jgi:ubiquitin C-terminal hydrolase